MSIIKLNNRAIKDATAFGSITGLGNLVFISRSTASSSASVSITSGISSTYKEYIFVFNNLHPASNSNLQFQTSTNGGSSYGVTVTTTFFYASHQENDGEAIVTYNTGRDHAQATDFIYLTGDNMESNNADASVSGYLHLFEPSSTTFVKHYMSNTDHVADGPYQQNNYSAGYFNTTTAINAIQFKLTSGNIDSGTVDMYGVL
tara:strand:- start:9 stop:617 length:609 start_codon:yes stop_codon:yes gene_type:complete